MISVVEISKASKKYARSYKIEIIDTKDPLAQLAASKSTVLLCKPKQNGDIEYAPAYFDSATKTVINSDKYHLDKSLQEILYIIDNWINKGSGWITESIEAQYENVFIYSSLI